jgi:hypothetical protein
MNRIVFYFFPPSRKLSENFTNPRAVLDRCGKFCPPFTGIRLPDRPARNKSLYRLCYPAHTALSASLETPCIITGEMCLYEDFLELKFSNANRVRSVGHDLIVFSVVNSIDLQTVSKNIVRGHLYSYLSCLIQVILGRDSSVGIASRYGLDLTGWKSLGGVVGGGGIFCTPVRCWVPSSPLIQWVPVLCPRGKSAEARR